MQFCQIILSILTFFSVVAANADSEALPLFASDDVLDITFEVPMQTIIAKAERKLEVDGLMHYTEDDGRAVTLRIKMNTRGKSRLEYCSFPPLKINLKRKETGGTLFAGQNKLKVVTRCRSRDEFERYLLQEFSIYGAFNVLSGRSFRVRMLNVTYRDSSSQREDEIQTAFFIETDKEVAARYGMEELKLKKVEYSKLEPAHTSKLTLFQYLIGNTDWSLLQGPPDEGCCHNNKLIVTPGAENGWIMLPYDFDQAGLINTRYAEPSEAFRIQSVRRRVYRGRCSNLEQLDGTIAIFNERRAAIEAALLPAALEGKYRKKAASYIEEFYDVINDPKKLKKNIVDKCVGRKHKQSTSGGAKL
jgi:hypothetical protein